MTAPKPRTRIGPSKNLRCDHFGAVSDCVNALRKLENVEFRIRKHREDITIELGRIAARQFNWQRGYVNIPQFYRNAFVYGQGECADHFEEKYGITLNRFSQIGFILFVFLKKSPNITFGKAWQGLGVGKTELEKALSLLALPFPRAVKEATVKRRKIIHTADKPSILRQAPCLRFGANGERIRAPLPELILERVTSGVFYDFVGAAGSVRNDYAKRFEAYSAEYLSHSLPSFEWETEFPYRMKRETLRTPDILCERNEAVSVALECKATRMSQEAMFGEDPMNDRGYQEMIKGVFQLWRFFSHCRRGYTGRTLCYKSVGVVLTLDNWLVLAERLRTQVLEGAKKLAAEKDVEIIENDMKPIVFVAVPELERTLAIATDITFMRALKQCNTKEYQGWRLDSVHNDLAKGKVPQKREYPFKGRLGELLPWWDEMREPGFFRGARK